MLNRTALWNLIRGCCRWFGLAAIVAIALNVVDTHPLKVSELFFSSPTCQIPCALNIVPGITPYTDAKQIFSAEGIAAEDDYGNFSFERAGTTLHIKPYPADPREGKYIRSLEISTYMRGKVISLGDLINLGYEPHRVFRNKVTIAPNGVALLITFGTSDQILAELLPENSLNAQSGINTLTLSFKDDADWTFIDKVGQGLYREEISWIGYASVDQYLALPSID